MKLTNYPDKATFFFNHDIKTEVISEQLMERHYHDLFEIYYLESGSCIYFIDNKSYELLPGDIAIIPAGVIHNTLYQNSKYSRMLINCSPRFIPASVMPMLKGIRYLYRNSEIAREIREILRQIEGEYDSEKLLSDEMLYCYMHMLFLLLVRHKNFYDNARSKNEYVENAIRYVRKNFSAPISLSEVAKMLSVSPEHFSREFKKETGFGFCEYVNLLRLKKSEQLLREEKNLSITEISEKCGFNDSNYFSVKFKKMYGVSPKKMQQTHRKAKEQV